MPDVRVACPHCGQHIAADSGYIGATFPCPACTRIFAIEQPHAAAIGADESAAPLPAPVSGCPSCGSAMARGAIICNRCDFNLATGKHMTKVRRKVQVNAPPQPSRWYNTAYPYMGAALLVLFLLDFLGRKSATMGLTALVLTIAYFATAYILVLGAAKDDGLIHLLLILLFPPYALFYLLVVNRDKSLISLWVCAWIAVLGFPVINPHFN